MHLQIASRFVVIEGVLVLQTSFNYLNPFKVFFFHLTKLLEIHSNLSKLTSALSRCLSMAVSGKLEDGRFLLSFTEFFFSYQNGVRHQAYSGSMNITVG